MIIRSILLNQGNLLNRIKLTLGIILLARLGTFISIPGVDQIYFSNELKNNSLFASFSPILQGDSFLLGVFTLGILPNLNASIVIQILGSVFPPLKRLTKEGGELGQKKIVSITRYLTAIIAFQYGLVIAFTIKPYVFGWDLTRAFLIAITLMTGSLIILWLSEIINESGIGNGTSLFIFINIIAFLPGSLKSFIESTNTSVKLASTLIFLVGIFSIVIIQATIRKIQIISLKELLQNSFNKEARFIEFPLNPSGIMPVILSSSLLNLIVLAINNLFPLLVGSISNLLYSFGYFILTLCFSYFYSTITLNPVELSTDFRKRASSIPSIKPGLPTMKFLQEVITRISLLGGLFLAIIVTIPNVLSLLNLNFPEFRGIGGTSLLILAGVAVDLSRQIRTYSIFGYYDNIELKDT
jgi:preprotein translocase subunit SecY